MPMSDYSSSQQQPIQGRAGAGDGNLRSGGGGYFDDVSERSTQPGGSQQPNSQNARRPRRRPQINILNDPIRKIVDETADEARRSFENFLSNFQDDDGNYYYVEQVKSFSSTHSTTVYVDYEHVVAHDNVLADIITKQFYRMDPYLRKAVQNLVQEHLPGYLRISNGISANDSQGLMREFWVSWYNLGGFNRLRAVHMETLGTLTSICGTVTRTSEIRPELLFGTFRCEDCGTIIKDFQQEFKYTEPTTCPNPPCMNKLSFQLIIEQSKFADWQKIRIQENADEVPSGAMPRSMDVIVRNEVVERAKAGDTIVVTGCPIVIPDVAQLVGARTEVGRDDSSGRRGEGYGGGMTGLKSLGVRDLNYKLSFYGCYIRSAKERSALTALHDAFETGDLEEIKKQFNAEEMAEIQDMMRDKQLYQKLVSSIAPHIFGHDDVKKGVLLQMLGGVHKKTPEGINLRGDINVCIVGDPSTAKSQFLKYVASFMPRAIYTSGKASSAAGLTASVVKDEDTGEFTIEAGALMLADNGICCIDEFDKMDIVDQVAIHEAMEQQTISIAKAGIQATLNARASILAAANPIYGRYNKKISLKQNINMSPPIMSRFDLFFVILDECDEVTDYNIGRHIIRFHQDEEDALGPPYSTEQLQRYLRFARALKPKITGAARDHLVEQYREIRSTDSGGVGKTSFRITVRQLESMVRLSEALAKLEGSLRIRIKHVREAANLLKKSIVKIEGDDYELPDDGGDNVLDSSQADDDAVMGEAADLITPPVTAPKKFKMTSEEFNHIGSWVIARLKSERMTPTADDGLRKSELIQGWLEERESLMSSEEDITLETKKIRGVLARLVKDNVVLEQREMSLVDESLEGPDNDPIIMLHPNMDA